METLPQLWATCAVLGHPHSKKVFSDVQREPHVFWVAPITSGPVKNITLGMWKE